ncbi:MAG: DUF3833 family protein [Pseudomonadota bacterium]
MMEQIAFFAIGFALALAVVWGVRRFMGFPAQDPQDYAHLGPELDLRARLKGPLLCQGVIFGPSGRVSSRFNATMNVTWDGRRGTMQERFVYDDGSEMERFWLIQQFEDGQVEVEAADVEGTGRGHIIGNALRLTYRYRLPEENGGHVLNATDWMYLLEDGTIINRSQFRKFGILAAELVATIRPKGDETGA